MATHHGRLGALPSRLTTVDAAGRAQVLRALQRLYGNAAVQRLVDAGTPVVQRDSVDHVTHPDLAWTDFKGKPGKGSTMDAMTYSERTGLRMTATSSRAGGAWTAEATLDPASLDLKASMNRNKSWVRKGRTSADLLRHEQGHFDIQHVLVEKGETEIRAVASGVTGTGTASTGKGAIAKAFADLQTTAPFTKLAALDTVLGTAQHDYDEDPVRGTDHGTKAAEQAQWEADIIANLPAYPIP